MPGCRVIFTNGLPSDYQVTVIGIGAKFFYKAADGSITHDWQTSKEVNLSSGQSDNLDSNEPNSCVGAVLGVMTCIQNGQTKTLSQYDPIAAGLCGIDWEFKVCPKPVSQDAYQSIDEALNAKPVGLIATGSGK